MAEPLSSDRLLSAFREEGLDVVEYRDWRTHNRNHVGAWGPVHGVMIHHTVTAGTQSSVRLCYDGHTGLPGPLCHTVGAKDGTMFMVGHGRTNHAGLGDPDVLSAVIEDEPTPPVRRAAADGNARFYGLELVNLGNGRDPWPEAQVDAAARWSAALCRAHGWSEMSVVGHKEWQPGKVDPTFDMNEFRRRVGRLLGTAPGPVSVDVPHVVALGLTEPFDMNADHWVSVSFNAEWSDPLDQHFDDGQTFASGCVYNGFVHLATSGISEGSEVQVRLVEDDAAGGIVKLLPMGSTKEPFFNLPICGRVSRDRKIKVRVRLAGSGSVTVERVEVKALVWPL